MTPFRPSTPSSNLAPNVFRPKTMLAAYPANSGRLTASILKLKASPNSNSLLDQGPKTELLSASFMWEMRRIWNLCVAVRIEECQKENRKDSMGKLKILNKFNLLPSLKFNLNVTTLNTRTHIHIHIHTHTHKLITT